MPGGRQAYDTSKRPRMVPSHSKTPGMGRPTPISKCDICSRTSDAISPVHLKNHSACPRRDTPNMWLRLEGARNQPMREYLHLRFCFMIVWAPGPGHVSSYVCSRIYHACSRVVPLAVTTSFGLSLRPRNQVINRRLVQF